MGTRVLMVLLVALVLAFIVWIPVEIWGKKEAVEVAPKQPGQQIQSQQPTPAPSQPPAPNPAPATPNAPAQ
jgi:hypothetical protein